MTNKKPDISKKAFWDVDFDKIDFEQNATFVINKTFNYGTFDDQISVIRFYGIDKIKTEVVKIAYFRKPVFAFICGFFGLDKSQFVAFQRRQAQPNYWDF
jgi:hypothetical protein